MRAKMAPDAMAKVQPDAWARSGTSTALKMPMMLAFVFLAAISSVICSLIRKSRWR